MIPIRALVLCASLLALAGCSSGGAGISVSIVPGVSIGVGVNQSGRVTGNLGVGTSVPLGDSGARAGVGIGTGTVLHEPERR